MPPFPSPSSESSIQQEQILIPGLPNDVASQILSMVPYSCHSRLKTTCKSWFIFLSSETLISLRRHFRHLSHLLCVFPADPAVTSPYLFDPRSLAWRPLPPMPCNPHVYGLCNFAAVSLGPHLYVLGGSVFDTRSYPLDRPSPSAAAFRFNFEDSSWDCLAPMISPRGSFACAAINSGQIIVAGGGSRHHLFSAAGSRMSLVERYDVAGDMWEEMDGLPGERARAGCVGFQVGEREFWVMGGYGEGGTISGVFPVDDYYKDVVVMDVMKNGGKGMWREIGDTWSGGERVQLGKIVVVEDEDCRDWPGVFMLKDNEIFRYDMASNSWQRETSIPRKAPPNSSLGFVVLDGELHVMAFVKGGDFTEIRRPRQQKRAGTLFIQIYHPRKKTWRSLFTKPPFPHLDFKTAVTCTVQL